MRSLVVGLIFVPYHFVCDVARKVVFLRREKIEAWLLGSVCFSGAVTVLTLIYYMYIDKIYLFDGQMPLIVPIITTSLLFLLYALFKESVFKLYDDLQDYVTLDEVLNDVVAKEFESEITETADEFGQEIVTDVIEDIADSSGDAEINGKASEESAVDVIEQHQSTEIPFEVSTNLDDFELQIDQALSDTSSAKADKVLSKSKVTPAAKSQSEKLTASAKQVLYKNKMLQSLQAKLAAVKSETNLSEDEIERVCREQDFIKAEDFIAEAAKVNIDEILFEQS